MKHLPFLVFAALCVLLAFAIITPKKPSPSSALIGKPFPALSLETGDVNQLISGHVAMVNLFASWCLPCTVEHPILMQMDVLPIIGIAWKNKPQDADLWLAKRGNPYKHVLYDEEGQSTIKLALTGVPETFIVDKKSIIRYHTREPLTEDIVKQDIIPLVKRLEEE